MGCCTSAPADQAADVSKSNRRRLSVGMVAQEDIEGGGGAAGDGADEDRGLIANLLTQDLVTMANTHNEDSKVAGHVIKKFSIGSETDACKTSFANKTIKQIGDEVDPIKYGLGFTCRKGLKPESPNQDSWVVLNVENNFSVYGVFDGHGAKGHDVSQFVKENLPKLIVRDPRFKTDQVSTMLKDVFKKTQSLVNTLDRSKKLNAQMSGTTATVIVHDLVNHKLNIAHVADSTAVLGRYEDASRQKLQAIQLTRDHKPNLKEERARIEKAGGRVVFDGYANHRVYAKNGNYPGLNMSRCLGDLLGHSDAGCSAEPDVAERPVDPLDHVLLLCSDGVWEFIKPLEAVQIVAEFGPGKAMIAADRLAKEAWDRWIQEEGGAVVDDITVVVVFLNQKSR